MKDKRKVIKVIIQIILLIALHSYLFVYESSPANGAKAKVTRNLGSDFQLTIQVNDCTKKKYISGVYKNMEFSPSGRYLIIETEDWGKYQMYLFDIYFVIDPLQWYLVEEDLNLMAEWIFRGNDVTIIKPDDKVILEFDSWDKEKDNIKFEYTITFSDGRESSGNTVIDYTEKTVVYVQSYN